MDNKRLLELLKLQHTVIYALLHCIDCDYNPFNTRQKARQLVRALEITATEFKKEINLNKNKGH